MKAFRWSRRLLGRPFWRLLDTLVVLVCAALVVALWRLFDGGSPPDFDEAVLRWLGDQLRGPVGDGLLQVYRASGVHFTGFLVLAALIYVALRRWWKDLRLLVMATAGILVLVDLVLKPLFDRARPLDKLLKVDGRSFPSGHAAGAVAFYGAMVLILAAHYPRLRRPLAIGAGLWVALVWLSTLYARAHWPTDLVAGGAVGLAWLTICLSFWRQPPPGAPSLSPISPAFRRSVMPESAVPPAADVLLALRGLRSAPCLSAGQRQELRAALTSALAGCEWFTLGVMAPSADVAVAALRSCERALDWPALQEQVLAVEAVDDPSIAAADPEGPVFLKGNQRNGCYRLRFESGLGEGILITGHNPADPTREDTWGPLPLDLFDDDGTVGS